jgi:DDE superfamily endonuclease
VVEVKALACELPARLGLAFSRLSVADIRAEAISRGIVADISGTTIWRWLAADAIRPWAHRSWVFPRDPDFATKAGRVLDLYARRSGGRRLGPNEYVISADEKTGIQVRIPRHPGLGGAPRRVRRVEHEYRRAGTLAYLAAWDVHRARLFGRVAEATGKQPFDALVAEVMAKEPYSSAQRVFWIVDNGTAHRGDHAVRRLAAAHSNLELVHLPVHASWLNQIEIYFSVLQRKVLTPHTCESRDELAARLLAFQDHYARIAKPFEWKFTRADLDALLSRIATQETTRLAAA